MVIDYYHEEVYKEMLSDEKRYKVIEMNVYLVLVLLQMVVLLIVVSMPVNLLEKDLVTTIYHIEVVRFVMVGLYIVDKVVNVNNVLVVDLEVPIVLQELIVFVEKDYVTMVVKDHEDVFIL